jgi:hypothetical protein
MRVIFSTIILLLALFGGGCAIVEKEMTNRGGYLDAVLDDHWMKADSKRMRALRAFAMQASLARVASVSAKNESDRQLLAIRIGALTQRFSPIYACAFNDNPLRVAGAESDPCFYYDSAMVEYSTGLFDLAMVALPLEDAQKLLSTVTGSFVSPINIVDLLNTLLQIGKDAIKYGRVVGALYRDTVELEVQVWLATPEIDRRPSFQVTEDDVRPLRDVYQRGNDDMPAWIAAMAALRGQGLEPLPQRKFFVELDGLMNYICTLITKEANPLASCQVPLPALNASAPIGLGNVVPGRGPRVIAANPVNPKPTPTSTPTSPPTPTPGCPTSTTLQEATKAVQLRRQIITGTARTLSSAPANTITAKTVNDTANAIVPALTCISAQLQQASDLTAAQAQKDAYRNLRNQIGKQIDAIRKSIDQMNSAGVSAQDAAVQVNLQITGATGLTGVVTTIDDALKLLGP